MIKNNKLNKFLTKGLTYRVPQAINIPKAMIEISVLFILVLKL